MSRGETWAVVPVKPFRLAKQRLAVVLEETERVELARAMFDDVLCALDDCRQCLTGVIVVTADRDAAAVARRHQAVLVTEAVAAGMNGAVGRVIDRLSRTPGAGMIVIPADLPQISVSDIEELSGLMQRAPAVALVRATCDGGTNILASKPAGVIAPCFGADSFKQHCLAATRARVTPSVWFAPRLGVDLDRPEDLVAFLSFESATHTHAFLSERRIHERLIDAVGRGGSSDPRTGECSDRGTGRSAARLAAGAGRSEPPPPRCESSR